MQFLWPFQSFSNSKGQKLLNEYGYPLGRDMETLEKDQPMDGFSQKFLSSLSSESSEDIVVLGTGNCLFIYFSTS